MSSLPFPGYSWTFTQHAIGLQPKTLYSLLACAALAKGNTEPGIIINRVIVENGLLTDNVRDGQVDAWRDYQQILAEVGLIYSTKIHRALKLTPAGEMFLAGDIGFSELMTIQALRYQYPNGQKSTIQSRVRQELLNSNISAPDTLIELMLEKGVFVKPGLLVLRILIEMYKKTGVAYLSIDECGRFLVPVKRNIDWEIALQEIFAARAMTKPVLLTDRNIRRNIQDWFKFLDKTDIFAISSNIIVLTDHAKNIISILSEQCDQGEKINNFWSPKNLNPIDKESWFAYFGDLPFGMQLLMPPEEITEEYKTYNYVGGFEEDEDEQMVNFGSSIPGVTLTSIEPKKSESSKYISQGKDAESEPDDDEAWQRFSEGILKRKAKINLHDSIVRDLAAKFTEQGATVFEDRDSLDLLVQWHNKSEGIFEVKTVNKRSLQQRLRLAIGQLEEYSYRRYNTTNTRHDKIIVINATIPEHAWQIDFLTKKLNIGLLCKSQESYKAYVPQESTTGNIWTNL